MEPIDCISNNISEILYHLYNTLKLDIKNQESKNILIKARIALRDLEKIKGNMNVIKSN